VLYTHGRGAITVGDLPVPFEPGTIVCLPPILPHRETSESGFRNIHFTLDAFPAPAGAVPSFRDEEHQPFLTTCNTLLHEYHLRQPGWEMITQSLFAVLMSYFTRWQDRSTAPPYVAQLKSILVRNLHDVDFDTGAAMRQLPVSPNHLRRAFVKSTGKTPLQFLIDMRINEARMLLAMGGYEVKEVAMRCGFNDPYYFSRMFKQTAGVSPTQFAMKTMGGGDALRAEHSRPAR
jgi:AraC-like DNA-binding protein